MNIKIFTCVSNLTFQRENQKVLLGDNLELFRFQEEVQTFIRDKKDAEISWLQSTGNASTMGFGAISVPFTQLTAIVTW